jgi:D-glycero-alpha-D-manno-heptose-7-phosphate kinase
MIIARSPLRITLGGGGTDLPSYYSEHSGFLVAAAIDKYVYITLHRAFERLFILKYSSLERVETVDEIQHRLFREALRLVGASGAHLELASMADIPAGTGLGSSGSFTVALLKALHGYKKNLLSQAQLAEQACHIEIDILREPVGKQDQYASAFGGLTAFTFNKDGSVEAKPLQIAEDALYALEDSLILFYTGKSRKASAILKDQDDRSKGQDRQMTENLHYIKGLGLESQKALESGNIEEFGSLMHRHWMRKRERTKGMSDAFIDECYDYGMANGALGGKLIGAGGGGFIMFLAADKMRLRAAMRGKGLQELRFRFEFEGAKMVIS